MIQGSWEWVYERAKGEMSLPLRRLLEPLVDFDRYLGKQRSLYASYESFKPVREYIDAIRDSLTEGIGWIERYDQDEIQYGELEEFLEDDAAESLEGALDDVPDLLGAYPNLPSQVEALLNDVESWFEEHVFEDISDRGYHVYHVLKGAV